MPHSNHPPAAQSSACCGQAATRRNPYDIILIKKELLHDIDDDTRQLQRFRKFYDIPLATDENYRYIIDRYIERAVNHVRMRLTAYIATDNPHHIVNNHVKNWQEHHIYIAMPATWPPENLHHLRDAIHAYIVRTAEVETLSLAIGPNDPLVQQYRVEADEADAEVVSLINARLGPLTVPFTPFG